MSIEDDIKSIAKDGADLSGVLGQIEGLNPMNGLTKDNAFDFIKDNQVLLSTFDSEVSKSVNSGVENFKNKGMQQILKEKEDSIRAEINPKETPEQKKIRELEQRIEASDKEKTLSALQDELSLKAKELEFDTIKARDYAVYGENAVEKLEADATWFKTELESRLSSEIKSKYSKKPPVGSKLDLGTIDDKIMEARKSGDGALALKLQMAKARQT